MLLASRRIELFERYRIPYAVDEKVGEGCLRIVRADGAGGEILSIGGQSAARPGAYHLDSNFLFARLAPSPAFASCLDRRAGRWHGELDIVDRKGAVRANIARADDGSIALPFDIDEPFENLLRETYLANGTGSIRGLARRGYYRARPALPYSLQMAFRRGFRHLQERAIFPAWPIETSFHNLETLILSLIESVVGEPLPWIASWPAPYTWAIILTHDIERLAGYRRVEAVLDVEQRQGFRSAWYLVPERDYTVEDSMLEVLRAGDCEICLHGLRHDGRDLSPGTFEDRLPAMRGYLERWGAEGFRGPSTQRDPELLRLLGVRHDSSWSDVARYEPQPGGTGSWLPFFIGEVVELPITLPMDHTLFELRRVDPLRPWLQKADFLRRQEGMALMITHPDYLVDAARLGVYERFLETHADEKDAWRALPRDVAAWWRNRAASTLERRNDTWVVVGPAGAQARICPGFQQTPVSEVLAS